MPTPRRLPFRLVPGHGESFDSWFIAYADLLDVTPGELATAVGADKRFLGQPPLLIAKGSRRPDVPALAHACGIQAERLLRLWQPLARYEQSVRTRIGRSGLLRLALPLHWSRYCPVCLGETGGRWQVAWRLWWFTTCPAHEVLLVSGCPSCGCRQRQRPSRASTSGMGAATTLPAQGAIGMRCEACGDDLVAVPVVAPQERTVLEVQRRFGVVLDHGVDPAQVDRAVDRLADLLVVAAQAGLDARWMRKQGVPPAQVAAVISRAWQALADPHDGALDDLPGLDATSLPGRLSPTWKVASPALLGRVLESRARRLSPIDRLRWRMVGDARWPDRDQRADVLAARSPERLWPEWAVRLSPSTGWGMAPDTFRLVAASAMRIPGSTLPSWELFTDQDNPRAFVQSVSYELRRISKNEHGGSALGALIQLSERLQEEGAPIDYGRRRRIASDRLLLDDAGWERICAEAGMQPGGAAILQSARHWIHETLTGSTPGIVAGGTGPDARAYDRFALAIPPVAADLLDRHARRILDEQGCAGEPLTWAPPWSWVDLDRLPGPEPSSVDVEEVGRLLREGEPVGRVADHLGVTIEHIRLVVRRRPPHVRMLGGDRRRVAVPRPPLAEPTPERLRQLIVGERRSVHAVAVQYRLDPQAIAAVLRREGIRVASPGRAHKVPVTADWLKTEYLVRQRSLRDIAVELIVSKTAVFHLMREHGVPVRGSGPSGRWASRSSPRELAEPLASALRRKGGSRRVQQFRVLSRARSLRQGAKALGMAPSVALGMLVKLERTCRGVLLVRARPGDHPQEPTPLGRMLLQQASDHFGPMADSELPGLISETVSRLEDERPAREPGRARFTSSGFARDRLPDPISGALRGRGALERVRRFQVFSQARSLTHGAKALSTTPSVLRSVLVRLERDCGGALLIRARPVHHPQELTALGRLLLQQADEQFGPNPITDPELPELLGKAVGGRDGERRVRWFLIAARSGSRQEAADILGVAPSSISKCMKALGEACGGQVLVFEQSRHRLTILGRRLLIEADRYLHDGSAAFDAPRVAAATWRLPTDRHPHE